MTDAKVLAYIAEHFVAADFHDEQIPDRTVLKIAVPHGTPVSVDFKQTVLRAMTRDRVICGADDRCRLPYGHDGAWHDDGHASWPVEAVTVPAGLHNASEESK